MSKQQRARCITLRQPSNRPMLLLVMLCQWVIIFRTASHLLPIAEDTLILVIE
jgi:hypothetical protein